MKKLAMLFVILLSSFSLSGQKIIGQWNGVADLKVMKLSIIFHIEESSGIYKATMDSPDQKATGIPVTSISFDDPVLKIEIMNMGFSYEGILKNDTLIDGSFSQNGYQFPLTLVKTTKTENKRPQEPDSPYPYQSENIKFTNQNANIDLAGTLTYPKDNKRYPAVVLITGSGPQNRDEELLGHKPFLVLSDYLTRNGIAVLRYDDRGVVESEGEFTTSTSADFASDAFAAFNYLKKRKEIDPDKIGFIGHSEGGLITFMLAAKNKDIAFIVSMAGSAKKGHDILYEQRKMISSAAGVDRATFEQNELLIGKIDSLISKNTIEDIDKNMDIHLAELFHKKLTEQEKEFYAQQIRMLASPWMQYFLEYDPAKDISLIECPLFAISGQKDLQVDAETNLERIKALAPHAKTKVYADLNHLFQHCETGLMEEYSQIDETISPEVMNDIAKWILTLK